MTLVVRTRLAGGENEVSVWTQNPLGLRESGLDISRGRKSVDAHHRIGAVSLQPGRTEVTNGERSTLS
jgi:hypothetical protein